MKGYRLHDERIARSGGIGGMRSIKYELVDPGLPHGPRQKLVSPLRDNIAEATFSEYRKLYGSLNFSDFLTRRTDPSILEFWLLTLKLGVFYGSSRNKLPSEFDGYRGRGGDWQAAFASLEPTLREVLDESAWRNFMLTSQRGLAAKSAEQREQVVLRLLSSESAGDEAAIARLRPLAARFAEEFMDAADPNAFKAELFEVEIPQREAASSFGMTAAGTSQTCSKCKRWAGLFIQDKETYALRPHHITGLKVARVGDLGVVCQSDADLLKGSDLKRAAHAATRPPIGGAALELATPNVRAKLDDAWKKAHGNTAVFVCPFTDCHHVADADLQAALNIALRGYAKLRSDGKLGKAIDLMSFAASLNYEPVEFTEVRTTDPTRVPVRSSVTAA